MPVSAGMTSKEQEIHTIRSIFTKQSQSALQLFFLIALSIVLMVMDRHVDKFRFIREALSFPLAPLQYAVSWSAKQVSYLKKTVSSHDDLVQENVELKAERLLLRAKLQRFIAIETENNYLKTLSQSSRQIQGKTLIAELLNVDSEPFVNQVVLDKGMRNNVYIGQPVFDAYGVMGPVIQAGPISSRIMLINDPRSGVAVQSVRNGVRAIAMGDGYSNNLKLIYITKTADIKVGDLFLTSGLGDRYPEGYPVGKVLSVSKDPAHQFASIYLQPSAHLDSSRQVLLVWYQKHVSTP